MWDLSKPTLVVKASIFSDYNVNASHINFCLCVINMLTRTMKCCPALPYRNILVSVSFKVLLFTWDILHYNSLNIYIFCAELDLQTPELATVVIYCTVRTVGRRFRKWLLIILYASRRKIIYILNIFITPHAKYCRSNKKCANNSLRPG